MKSAVPRYAGALAAFALSWLIRSLLAPLLGGEYPNFIIFIFAVILTARYCGFWPALSAIAASTLVVLFFLSRRCILSASPHAARRPA